MKHDESELIYLESRAYWLAWRYELDEERVLNALKRLDITIKHVIMDDFFAYLEYNPCLETALWYFRPEVALKLFETADLESIRELLSPIERLKGMHVYDHEWLEEQCRWDAEQYLLPD